MAEDVRIGLETHVQLDTDSKLLCGCRNRPSDTPNTNVCETCLGHPGSKPRINEAVLRKAIQTSLSMGCEVNREFRFSRKTYFYPDMSKNFQTTQYEVPVGQDGSFGFEFEGEELDLEVRRVHIEEDPARLEHAGGSVSGGHTLVDYNRAGVPLLEIVTGPGLSSPAEARQYLRELARLLNFIGVYEPSSEYTLKSDANVSLEGGRRVEVKNITGTKEVEKALKYEISRQRRVGGEVEQETRRFSPSTGATEPLRQKETEEDYGYIVEPDLTGHTVEEEELHEIQEQLPESPAQKSSRLVEEYGISAEEADALVKERELAELFERLSGKFEPGTTASLLSGELKKVLNYHGQRLDEAEIEEEDLQAVVSMVEGGELTERNAEMVMRRLAEGDCRKPRGIAEEEGLTAAEDNEVMQAVEEVLAENGEAVEDYRSSDEEALNFLVGQVLQRAGGADPREAREMLEEEIDEG